MRLSIVFALLPALLVAGCSEDRGAVFSVPLDRAQRILLKTGLPPVFGSDEPGVEIRAYKPSEVTWIVSNDGSEFMRYTATLSEAGEGRTRVGLALKGSKSGSAGDVEKRFAENPSARNVYLVAMKEQIASSIEQRSLDMMRIYPALGAFMLANMSNIRKSADEAAKASEQLKRR